MSHPNSTIEINPAAGGVSLAIKAVPGASRSRVAGAWNGALRVTVAAPPEGGKANKEIIRLLAEVLGVRRGDVAIVAGQSQPLKRVFVAGQSVEAVRERIRAAMPAK